MSSHSLTVSLCVQYWCRTVCVQYWCCTVCTVLVSYSVCCWFVVFVLLRKYYGFTESFPTRQMLTRSETGKKRNFYFASNLLRELTIRNEHTVKVCQGMG